jgi:mono/diheme cytochrome c family protein
VGDHAQVFDDVGGFDGSVQTAEEIPLFQRIWVHGCGDNRNCRMGLLIGAFDHCQYDTPGCLTVASVISSSPLANERIGQARLSEGDRGLERIFAGLLGPDHGAAFEDVTAGAKLFATSDSAKQAMIDRLKNLPKADNPATSRLAPTTDYFSRFSAGYFPGPVVNEFDISSTRGDLPRALQALMDAGSPLFDKKALTTQLLLSELETKLSRPRDYAGRRGRAYDIPKAPADMRWAKVSAAAVPTFFSSQPLNALVKNCGGCHQTGASFPPQFLVGNEQQVLSKVTELKAFIAEMVEHDEMPPNPAVRDAFRASGDRDSILRFVKDSR